MEALKEGFFIMVIGMGTVFMFLTIMVYAMNISKKILDIVNKYFPEDILQESKKKRDKTDNDAEIALAIAAAIHKGEQVQC
jgi:oxaloacetate decarboxylase gamma subunit